MKRALGWVAAAVALGAAGCGGETARGEAAASVAAASVAASAPAASVDAPASAAPSASAAAEGPAAPEAKGWPPRPIDMHVDTPYQVHFKGRGRELAEGHATMQRLTAGHYAGIVYPIYIPDTLRDGHPAVEDAEAILATVDALAATHASTLWPEAKGPTPAGKITLYLSIEGAGAFAADVPAIDRFLARGVRFVGPVHAHDNDLATSATGKDKKRGLSARGKELCERIYEKGALVDVSHMSDASFDDLAAIAERVGAPIVATHSNARAIADHRRNLTDAQLARIGKSGGVVGLNFHGGFVRVGGGATIDDVVAHAKHIAKVAGVDALGLGSDFDGASPPEDLADASRLPALADALREAGFSEREVHAIYGENVKRVLGRAKR